MLSDPRMELYRVMNIFEIKPVICEESLIVSVPAPEETEALRLPPYGFAPVVRIKRKVFDDNGRLLELCYLVDRADCYEFSYRFPRSQLVHVLTQCPVYCSHK